MTEKRKPPIDLDAPIVGAHATEHRPPDSVDFSSDVEELIDDLMQRYPKSDFLYDVLRWGEDKGWLTAAQHEALLNMEEGA